MRIYGRPVGFGCVLHCHLPRGVAFRGRFIRLPITYYATTNAMLLMLLRYLHYACDINTAYLTCLAPEL